MEIRTNITPDELNEMRSVVGWRILDTKQLEKAIRYSMVNIGIYENNKIVAMGRLVGDFSCKAMLTDIIVRPEYQGKGYGKIVVHKILETIYEQLECNEQLCIQANPTAGYREFYVKCGFIDNQDEQDGVSLWIGKKITY